MSAFTHSGAGAPTGEMFKVDPTAVRRVVDKFEALRQRRDNSAVDRELARLSKAAERDQKNLMPYLVDCVHAYATIGEIVARLGGRWGAFQEPVGL